MVDSVLGKPVNPDVLAYLKKSLQEGTAYNSDNFTLSALVDRQLLNSIELMPMETIELFAAAIENPRRGLYSKGALLAKLATYYLPVFKDVEKTEEFLKEAIMLHEEANYHMLLVEIYIPTGRLAEAEAHLEQAIRLDKHGIQRQRIAALREQLQQERTD
jgi:tetratricopeptide (TPR) repeat protein